MLSSQPLSRAARVCGYFVNARLAPFFYWYVMSLGL
jgi:hypothetical protein